MKQVRLDRYILDTLMADLVLHDRQPSAFLVYLQLWCRGGRRRRVKSSLRDIAEMTGLSKSAVQAAIRSLRRRRLIRSVRTSPTAVSEYVVQHPWRN